jgi:hypothetical protein
MMELKDGVRRRYPLFAGEVDDRDLSQRWRALTNAFARK